MRFIREKQEHNSITSRNFGEESMCHPGKRQMMMKITIMMIIIIMELRWAASCECVCDASQGVVNGGLTMMRLDVWLGAVTIG